MPHGGTPGQKEIQLTHYRNVDTIIRSAESYDLIDLTSIFESAAATGELDVLADDICYIVTKLFAGYSDAEKKRLREMFRTEITDHEVLELEFEE